MPNQIEQDNKMLDIIADNPDHPRAGEVMQKLGVDARDVKMWGLVKSNPDHPKAIAVRNKIYEKVANTRPALSEGLTGTDRLVVKNLLNDSEGLQVKYLTENGFNVRKTKDGLQVRRADESAWTPVDPSGFDLWDFGDVIVDAAEAAAGGIATGAKVMGAIGAPATGGSSILAGSLVGGAATAGVEWLKQLAGIGLGIREETNEEIGKKFLEGAVIPAGLSVIGKGLQKTGKAIGWGLGKAGIAKLKPNAQQIQEAAKVVGTKPTPGQLFATPSIVKREAFMAQESSRLAGMPLRATIKANKEAMEETAESLIADVSTRTSFEAGELAEKQILDSISEKLAPAEAIYQQFDELFKDTMAYTGNIRSTWDDLIVEGIGKDTLAKFKNIDDLVSLQDVKKFREVIGRRGLFAHPDPDVRYAAKKLYAAATEDRADTLLKQAGKMGEDALEQIKQADSIYKKTAGEVEAVFGKASRGVKGTVKNFFEKTPEIQRISKIIKTNDPKKIQAAKEAFPEAFETLKDAKLNEIFRRGITNGRVNTKRLTKAILDLPEETARLLFNESALEKVKALQLLAQEAPEMFNPSKSGEFIEFAKGMVNPVTFIIKQLDGLGRVTIQRAVTNPAVRKDLIGNIGKALDSEIAKSAALFSNFLASPLDKEITMPSGEIFRPPTLGGR